MHNPFSATGLPSPFSTTVLTAPLFTIPPSLWRDVDFVLACPCRSSCKLQQAHRCQGQNLGPRPTTTPEPQPDLRELHVQSQDEPRDSSQLNRCRGCSTFVPGQARQVEMTAAGEGRTISSFVSYSLGSASGTMSPSLASQQRTWVVATLLARYSS